MNRNTESAPSEAAEAAGIIPFSRPTLDEREEAAVLRVLRSGWLTTASECQAFEAEFASAVKARHAIAVNSGTSGLHLALEAVGVSRGDKVVTTPYTFTASAEVIRYLDADPVFVDIREEDLNLNPDELERALAEHPDIVAAMPVHIGGHACQMEVINRVCEHYAVHVIEDAAHGFPGTCANKALGTIGEIGVYSFYANKTLTTGEGGMIVTEDDALARRMKIMRLHGIDREVWSRYTSSRPSWEYQVVEAGYKYNLPDILAAIGRVQLAKSPGMNEERRAIARRYRKGLANRDYLRLPIDSDTSSWHLYVVRIDPNRLSIDRNEFISRLADRGIGTSVHYIPLHIMPYYRDRYGLRPEEFPVSLEAYQRAISLPIYPGLSEGSVERIIGEVIRIGDDALRR